MSENKSAAEEREKTFIYLYKKFFPKVASYVSKRGGSLEEAKDIFQDALIFFYEKETQGFQTRCQEKEAYLFGMAKNLWLKKYAHKSRHVALEPLDLDLEETSQEAAVSESRLMRFLETAGARCMEMLRHVYYDQLPMQRISELFGFSGVRSATVQKYKCLEKVRDQVKQKSLVYEDFQE